MAIVERHSEAQTAGPVSVILDALPGLLGFIAELALMPSVRKLGYSSYASDLDIWVLTDTENLAEAEEMFAIEHKYHDRFPGWLHVELHPRALSEIREANLPRFEVLFQR